MKEQFRHVRTECLHYVGDRPCAPHKTFGVVCDACEHYKPRGQRVLIVKLDAIGDVLRTTCILEPLWAALEEPHITWVTRPESAPLLQGNRFVARVVAFGAPALTNVLSEPYDRIICLDGSRDATQIASIALGTSRRTGREPWASGFTLRDGVVQPADDRARAWWEMGLWDDLKKSNQESYQTHMMRMLGLEGPPGDYVLELTPAELGEARDALRDAGLWPGERFLGLNVGGGGRWEYKRWTEPHMLEFIRLAGDRLGMRVALFGGEAERELVYRLLGQSPKGTFFPGVHPVRRFAGLLAMSDALVTGDSLAMHLSLAMKRPTVVLFGPSSMPEIEVYGRGEKLAPEIECLCCYLPRCDRKPYCQELIEPEQVLAAVERLLIAEPSPEESGLG